MLSRYFKALYKRTMHQAYVLADDEIGAALKSGGKCLDCGAHGGHRFNRLSDAVSLEKEQYFGVEWNSKAVELARVRGLNVQQADLNMPLQFDDDSFRCIFGLSVLEHLLNPCLHLRECYRCLELNGSLVILTPNISTYFTIALLLAGKMPSSGPHPDSDLLLKNEEILKVSEEDVNSDLETDTPVHRHLVVFSYRVLKKYLELIGFREIRGYGFGLYPFPNFM